MKLATTYLLLAVIATLMNIAAQDLCSRVYSGPFSLILAVVAGTGAGLICKYLLDARYIFRFRSRNLLHGSQTFFWYTVAGLATTLIFWCFEFGFDHLFRSKEMRYAGAVIGLSIGYLCKYQLDRRFVFRQPAA
jgi:putative flippase GtrA